VKIKIILGTFYSEGDENRFFQGLSSVRGLQRYVGLGRGLILTVSIGRLTRDSLMDLIALFWRYQIPLEVLASLGDKPKFSWLKEHEWYWHHNMFGNSDEVRAGNQEHGPMLTITHE
jgi:hypothetical protein